MKKEVVSNRAGNVVCIQIIVGLQGNKYLREGLQKLIGCEEKLTFFCLWFSEKRFLDFLAVGFL